MLFDKEFYFLNLNSLYVYCESKYLFLYSKLGALKCIIPFNWFFFFENGVFFLRKKSLLFIKKFRIYMVLFFSICSFLFFCFNSVLIGFFLKFKVIGLGHRCYFLRSMFLLKLGYSHLNYKFIPFELSTKKKKKKKMYHRLNAMNMPILNIFFFKLQLLRIPDVYNLNGIFSNYDLVHKKEGKKSFLL